MATMKEVIYDAILAMCDGIANEPRARQFSQDIAAAVAAHLASDAMIETMADGIAKLRGVAATNGDRKDARAAIRAALGEHEGVGRG